jgi:hypothetical protein
MFSKALKKQQPYEQYARKYIDLMKIAMTNYPKLDTAAANLNIAPTIKVFGHTRLTAFEELINSDREAAMALTPTSVYFVDKYDDRETILEDIDMNFKYDPIFGL